MHISCRAIIVLDEKILLIHRIKIKEGIRREYHVIPGGKQEGKEGDYQTLIREISEEVGILIEPKEMLLEFNSKYDDSIQRFYKCNYVSGKIGTGDGPELKELKKDEVFEVVKINKEELNKIDLVPEEIETELKEIISEVLQYGH